MKEGGGPALEQEEGLFAWVFLFLLDLRARQGLPGVTITAFGNELRNYREPRRCRWSR